MAFSLKKRPKSKSHIASGGHDDANALGEVLHRSTKTGKTKTKKKILNQLSSPTRIDSLDNDIGVKRLSSSIEHPIIYRNECLCDTHYDKQLVKHNYDLTVDKLFDLIFGSNEFVRTYRQAQRFYDDTATEWIMNDETNHRERILKYKVPYESTFIGKSTICTREKQILFHEVPGSHYMLETEVFNEGVKYSDTFSLTMRYCLVQTSITSTNLRVTAQVCYNKSVNGLIKQLIERNAYSASQEGLKDLNNRLNLITNFKMEKRRLSRGEPPLIIPTIVIDHPTSQDDALTIISSNQSLSDNNRNIRSFDSDKIMNILIILVAALLLMHIYLYMKLKHMDTLVTNLIYLLKM